MERNAAKDFQEHLVLSRVAWLGNIMRKKQVTAEATTLYKRRNYTFGTV